MQLERLPVGVYLISNRLTVMLIGAPNCAVEEMTQRGSCLREPHLLDADPVPTEEDREFHVTFGRRRRRRVRRRFLSGCRRGLRPRELRPQSLRTNAAAATAVKCRTDRIHSGYQYVCSCPYRPNIDALRDGAGIVDRSARGRLTLTGADRRAYLQGLLSNDIEALVRRRRVLRDLPDPAGQNDRGHAGVRNRRQSCWSISMDSRAAAVAARWTQFVFSEDVQISNDSEATAQIGVYGPLSAQRRFACSLRVGHGGEGVKWKTPSARCRSTRNASWDVPAHPIVVLSSDDIGVRGFDLVVPSSQKASILAMVQQSGGILVGAAAADACRVEGGRPLFGVDMTEDTIPLEAGIEDRAISLTKGCYVGQEVIIRVLHRGHGRVARRLVGMIFEPARRFRRLATGSDGRTRDRIDHQRGRLTRARAARCPWICAPRFRGARNRGDGRDQSRHGCAVTFRSDRQRRRHRERRRMTAETA